MNRHNRTAAFVLAAACAIIVSAAEPANTTTAPIPNPDTHDTAAKPVHEAIADTFESVQDSEITKAPPEPLDEKTLMALNPGDGAVFIPGYWQYNRLKQDYQWVPGIWRRTLPDQVWHPGTWVKTDKGYVRKSGYWSAAKSGAAVAVVQDAPPPLRIETQTTSPGDAFVWVPGQWVYQNGQYVWLPGTWEKPALVGLIWVPSRWVQTAAGFEYIQGHWDYPPDARLVVIATEPQADSSTTGKLFAAADADKDGKLTLNELQAVRPHFSGQDYAKLDTDRDGIINSQELLSAGDNLP